MNHLVFYLASKMSKQDLNTILDNIWKNLIQSIDDLAHPWRLPAIGTQGTNGPTVRTMVLRSVDFQKRTLSVYTDIRSKKIPNFRKDPRIAWLFYNDKTKQQVRAHGRSTIQHNNKTTELAWNKIELKNQHDYSTILPPGSKINHPIPHQIDEINLTNAYANFAIIECSITEIDWLQLSSKGHTRALFNWSGDNWIKNWASP